MTGRQLDALFNAMSGPLHAWMMEEGFRVSDGKMIEVKAIPDAWLAVADSIISSHFQSGSMTKANATLFAAVKRVVGETNARRSHPAYTGVAMMGTVPEYLPAWEWYGARGDDIRPFMEPGRSGGRVEDFRVLVPYTERISGQKVTTWRAEKHDQVRLHDFTLAPEAYLAFRSAMSSAEGSTRVIGRSPGDQAMQPEPVSARSLNPSAPVSTWSSCRM